jgi:glycosyltransferase involved in cell wall biosynthesis
VIVFCHLLNDRSGSPTVLRSTIEALGTHDKALLFIGSQGRGVLEGANVMTRRYWYRRSRFQIVTLFNYLLSQVLLYWALSRSRDIPHDATVFVNTLLPFAAMLWGRRTKRTVVVHIHEVSISPAPLRRLLTRFAASCADHLIYVSEDHLDRLPIYGPPAEVVSNPISPTLIKKSKSVQYVPRRTGAFEVVMLASLRSYKGIEEFMALAYELRLHDDISFTLVLNAKFEEVCAFKCRWAFVDNVSLHPRTNDPSLFYANADLVLNLSRQNEWIETFGLTIVEAMAFGVPVIVPTVGGPKEIVSHGIEGYCIDSYDSAALKIAILELAHNPNTAIAMSKAARARSREFSFDAYVGKLLRILTEL